MEAADDARYRTELILGALQDIDQAVMRAAGQHRRACGGAHGKEQLVRKGIAHEFVAVPLVE
jgi:hypothetical protein